MAIDEAGTLQQLRDVMAIAGRVTEEYGGHVVNQVGDNLLAQFSSAVDAVAGAVEIQRELGRFNSGSARERMRLRVGVTLGDAIVEGGQVSGNMVNLAARLESLAKPGGVSVIAAVVDSVRGRLPLEFVDTGEREIKNMQPVRVFDVLHPARSEAMPRSGQLQAWKIRRLVRSPGALVLAVVLAGFGAFLIVATPSGQQQASLIGGTSGFTLLFAFLFFRFGIEKIPIGQRSYVTVAVAALLLLFMSIQAQSAVGVLEAIWRGEPVDGGMAEADEPAAEIFPDELNLTWSRGGSSKAIASSALAPDGDSEEAKSSSLAAKRNFPERRWDVQVARCGYGDPMEFAQALQVWSNGMRLPNPNSNLSLSDLLCLDLYTMARYVIARNWMRLSSSQQHDFVTEFSAFAHQSILARLVRYGGSSLEIYGAREESNGDRTIKTSAADGEFRGETNDFRLRNDDGAWRIIDVRSDGIPFTRILRDQSKEVLESSGPEALIQLLREKNSSSVHRFEDSTLWAKIEGLVTEGSDGYLVVSGPDPDVKLAALVEAVNAARFDRYEAIAEIRNVTIEEVAAEVGAFMAKLWAASGE